MNSVTTKAIAGFLMRFILVSFMLFLPTWPLDFWQAWVFLVIFFIPHLLILIYLLGNDPHLLRRRLKGGVFAEKRTNQRIIMSLLSFFSISMLIVSGLDHAFNASHVPVFFVLAADAIILLGFWLQFRVLKENCFASAVVEIAAEQKVISTGPYAVVRHPMYSSALLVNLVIPIALGSWWGLLFSLAMLIMIIWRLLDEENLLRHSLPNYKEYCQKVLYRLIPHIW